jgi:hypothetical protein
MHPGAWRWSFWERALWGDAAVASGLEAAAAFLQFGLTAVTLNGERGITRPVSKTYGSALGMHSAHWRYTQKYHLPDFFLA